ncbi:hypothetical protein [Elstera sp.]|jgi:hypothetical protein|uniref:hypothetical protein n=1 Tax=Elstera sp. TaxID=1916664 RepID=UPI0037BF2269
MTAPDFTWPPVVTVYDLEQARQAATQAEALGVGLTLLSADSAADQVGVAWMATLGRTIRDEFPTLTLYIILDCGAAGGRAMAALRADVDAIVFTGGARSSLSLADQADDLGKGLLAERPAALDFLTLPADPNRASAALSDWLRGEGNKNSL